MLIFYLLCFWALLEKLPIMLNIMPITTAIMPKFVYNFIVFNNQITIVRLQSVILYYAKIQCSYFWPFMLNIMLMRILVPHFVPIFGLFTEVFTKTALKSFLLC